MFHTQKKKKKTQIYGCIEFNCYYKKKYFFINMIKF